MGEVDSWTTGEEFAANLLQERGVMETTGWTVSLVQDDTVIETPGLEYVLDLIGERELPPTFPKCPSSHLPTGNFMDLISSLTIILLAELWVEKHQHFPHIKLAFAVWNFSNSTYFLWCNYKQYLSIYFYLL